MQYYQCFAGFNAIALNTIRLFFQSMRNSDILLRMSKKKRAQINPGQVIIPVGHPNPPEPHEVDMAMILARHYRTTVEFIMPVDDFMRRSADIKMLDVEWEMKSPNGASKTTINTQFRRASTQAQNIVIDSRRTKLPYNKIEKDVLLECKKRTNIRKVIIIDKKEKVVEIQK